MESRLQPARRGEQQSLTRAAAWMSGRRHRLKAGLRAGLLGQVAEVEAEEGEGMQLVAVHGHGEFAGLEEECGAGAGFQRAVGQQPALGHGPKTNETIVTIGEQPAGIQLRRIAPHRKGLSWRKVLNLSSGYQVDEDWCLKCKLQRKPTGV